MGKEVYTDAMDYFVSLTGGRWKLLIIFALSRAQESTLRYSELKRCLEKISDKMLAAQLRELEADGLLERILYPVVPPKVEYKLTEKGSSLLPIIYSMHNWGLDRMAKEGIVPTGDNPFYK